MLDSITINKYKAIQSNKGLKLSELKCVNYLVGKNGCGKSSVLEMLSLLNYFKQENIIRNQKDRYVETIILMKEPWNFEDRVRDEDSGYLEIEGLTAYSKKNETIVNLSVSLVRNITLETEEFGEFIDIYKTFSPTSNLNFGNILESKPDWSSDLSIHDLSVKYIELNSKEFPFITTQSLNAYYYKKYKELVKKFIPEFEIALGVDHIVIDVGGFNLGQISSGQKTILTLINQIFSTEFWSSPTLILIDEPESNLHPEFQKIIPLVINEALNIVEDDYFLSQFIICTHSPFLISAAAEFYNSQKVYLIQDGQTVDLEGNLGKGSEGYSGGECILTANEMLGSDVNSLSSAVVFCEKTLCIILEDVVKRAGSKRNFTFSSMGGGGDNSIYVNLVKAYRYNINNLSIYAIIDKDENANKIIEKDKCCVINNTTPIEQRKDCIARSMASKSIFVSEFGELEDFYDIEKVNEFLISKNYPEWNKTTQEFFAKGYCKTNFDKDFKSGELKLELAEYMKQFIDKKDIKILCLELHDLIFN